MKTSLLRLLGLGTLLLALSLFSCRGPEPSASGFVHPGIDVTLADLDWLKAQVDAGVEPWAGYAGELKQGLLDFVPQPSPRVIRGPYGKPDIGASQWSASAGHVYPCAILWYLTRDEAYARKAIEIIEAWARKLRSFDENDTKLIIGLDGPEFANAAEILRYTYPGWTGENTGTVNDLLMEALFPYIRYYASEANGNWDGALLQAILSFAVFTDNREMFDDAVYHYLHGSCNGSLLKYVWPNGQCQEMTRDMGHAQMGERLFANAARVAYNQGVNLFEAAGQRLALGLEYLEKWNAGEEVDCYGPAAQRERGHFCHGLDWVYHYYTSRGLDLPYLKNAVDKGDKDLTCKILSHSVSFGEAPAGGLTKPEPSPIAYMVGAKKADQTPAPAADAVVVTPGDDLQAVLDACAGSGKTILLKAGEYKVSKTYNIPSGIHLMGEGQATVFICEPTIFNSAFAFDGFGLKDVTLSDFVIDGAWDHNPGYDPNTGRFDRSARLGNSLNGLTCQGDVDSPHSHITLRNLTVMNFSRNGVYFSDTEGLRIERCDFTENGSHVVPGDRIQHNLLLQNCRDVTILDSRLDCSFKGSGVMLKSCADVSIEACEIARNGWHGVTASDSRNLTVKGCLIEGNDACGVLIDYLSRPSEDITVTDNLIQYNNGPAVRSSAARNLSSGGNTYVFNGRQKAQEDISPKKRCQLEGELLYLQPDSRRARRETN